MNENMNDKKKKAIIFGIENTFNELAGQFGVRKIINVENELKKENEFFYIDWYNFNNIINLSFSTSLSYFYTEKERLDKNICDNIGLNLSDKGLDKLDRLLNDILNDVLKKRYGRKLLAMMKQDFATFDFNIKILYNILEESIDIFNNKKLNEFLKIKEKYFEYQILCPKCNNCHIPESSKCCNVCKRGDDS